MLAPEILLAAAFVWTLCCVLCMHFIFKPLSEDDGNWYYLACFHQRGIRQFDGYWNYGYFGIPWFSAIFYAVTGRRGPAWLQLFKIVWYATTALAICICAIVLWNDIVIAVLAGILFAVVVANPANLFTLTYGENFLVLPAVLAAAAVGAGLKTEAPVFFCAAGVCAALTVQIKPVGLIFSVFLGAVAAYASRQWHTVGLYAGAFLAINVLPLLLLCRKGRRAQKDYLQATFGIAVTYIKALFRLLRSGGSPADNKRPVDGTMQYLLHHQRQPLRRQWRLLSSVYEGRWSRSGIILFCALAQIAVLGRSSSFPAVYCILMFFVCWVMQYVQKNYHPPHFNQCWAPVCMLAAVSIRSIFDGDGSAEAREIIFCTVVLAGLAGPLVDIVSHFGRAKHDDIGLVGGYPGIFRMAGIIGRHIKGISSPEHRLYVWGDHPSIYIYADRMSAVSNRFFYPYGPHKRLTQQDELLRGLRENPPEWLLFFNYKIADEWNMARVEHSIGVRYSLAHTYALKDAAGRTAVSLLGVRCEFHLYRRDDRQYCSALIERAVHAARGGRMREV